MLHLKNNLQGKKSNDKKPVSETISERVRRHLKDIKSVITDEDIKNARIVLDIKVNAYEEFFA